MNRLAKSEVKMKIAGVVKSYEFDCSKLKLLTDEHF